MKYILSIICMLFLIGSYAQHKEPVNSSIFPEAKDGYKKISIFLKKKKSENNLSVEFSIGKMAKVDKCNHHFVVGTMKNVSLKGYGYTYYEFISEGTIAGTKKGCMDNELIEKFILGESNTISYNSAIPIVINLIE